jgi:hypothetical protein
MSLHDLLAFKFSVEKSAVICYLFYSFTVLSQFSVLVVVMIVCHGEDLFWSSLFGVLEAFYLNGQLFLEIWDIFCYYLVEYIMYSFDLNLFFDAHDLQIWSFDVVSEFLYFSFIAFELLSKSSVFFFNIYF